MRILYLNQYFVPPWGNSGTRSYEFARRLILAGHQVCIITSAVRLSPEYHSLRKTTDIEIEGIPTVIIPVAYSDAMSFTERIRAFIRFAALASWETLHHPADVVFATSTPLTIAIPGIVAHVWQRIPMVFEVRDLWPEMPIAVGALRNPIAKAIAHGLEWIAYHSSAHIVALSPGMAQGVMRKGIPAARVTVIPNCCDVDLFSVLPSRGCQIRQRLGLSPDQPLIVYTGAFGLINGLAYLVDIASAMKIIAPEIRFLLVGAGAEHDTISAKAAALGVLDQNLWIWDPLPKHQMPDVLAAATIATSFFVPLRPMWNNSANKFFDALAAGKPLAINYGGWQAELLEKSGAGIVIPPDDPVQAAHDLADFARDSQRLTCAAAASRDLGRTQFDRDEMAGKLEAVLCSVVKESEPTMASYPGKRLLDLTLSLVALTVFFPVFMLVAFWVWLKLGWPILFRQQRPGLHGKPFTILKFRTMTNEKDAKGNLLPAEERVTPFGQFLRSTSLDELPELFNVFRGDMSLIGPRPLLMQYLELYTPEQMRRHEVKPGITGWAQVNGRNDISWEEKFTLDVWYVDNVSLWLDLRILVMTFWKVLRRESINQAGYEGAEYFRGGSREAGE